MRYRIAIEIESENTMTGSDKEALIGKVAEEVNEFIEKEYPDMPAAISVSEEFTTVQDWETRFKRAYEEFQAEKTQICHDYEVKLEQMKHAHCKEIEAFAARCSDKESEISGLKRQVNVLKHKAESLLEENGRLGYMLNDQIKTTVMYAEQALANDEIPSCGYVKLTNATCYQDFIGILINNGYTVQIEPLNNGKNLGITILESEGE